LRQNQILIHHFSHS